MAAFGPGGRSAGPLLALPQGQVIARFDSYLLAQRAVDYLSDEKFDVRSVSIVGSDLRMVERVTGRLTYGRVALAGAGSGAWFGLFVGLLLSIFGNGQQFNVLGAVALGAGFGIVLSIVSYALTGGRRDFTSMSQIVASQYQVVCIDEVAGQARTVLSRLPGGLGNVDGPPAMSPAAPTPPVGMPPVAEAPVGDATPQPVPTGPTYGEMIDRQRAERREREAQGQG